MTAIAIATCAAVPDLDEDGPALIAALAARGVDAVPAVWDDAAVRWADFAAVVVRSTWDYSGRRDAFLGWAEGLPVPLYNAAETLRWSTDKAYLVALAEAGVPTVPTVVAAPGDGWPDWAELVVKPAVSAGCRDTGRFGRDQLAAARTLAEAIWASGRRVVLQPYQGRVDDRGETALIYLDGRYSHAICKGPMLTLGGALETALYRPETITPRVATAAERAVGDAALAAVAGALLYARVDVVPDADGAPRVLELELAEPSLFLGFDEAAADRLAAGIARRLDP